MQFLHNIDRECGIFLKDVTIEMHIRLSTMLLRIHDITSENEEEKKKPIPCLDIHLFRPINTVCVSFMNLVELTK